jgi:hypothetical protein
MILKILRYIGYSIIGIFGSVFVFYLLIFPVVGMLIITGCLYNTADSRKGFFGINGDDAALIPVVLLACALQAFCSYQFVIKVLIPLLGFK